MSDSEAMPYFVALLFGSASIIEEIPRAIYQISQSSGDYLPQIGESAFVVLTVAGLGYGAGKAVNYFWGSGKQKKPYGNSLGLV